MRQTLRWLPALAVGSVVLAWVARRWHESGFAWDRFAASFRELALGWVMLAAALILVTYLARALRWAVMLRPVKPDPSIRNLFVATAVGFTAVVLLGRAGEFVRPYLIAAKERVPLSSQLAAWALERIYDLLAVVAVFGFALTHVDAARAGLGPGLRWTLATGGYLVGGLASCCLLLLVLARWFSEMIRRRLLDALEFFPARHRGRADAIITAFVDGLASTRQAGALCALVLYTILEWGLITAGYWCLFRSSHWTSEMGIADVLVFMGFVSLGSIVQIPGVGGGVQVAAMVVLHEVFRVPLEPAAGLALLIWIITFIVVVPFGVILSLLEGINWRQIRRLPKEVGI